MYDILYYGGLLFVNSDIFKNFIYEKSYTKY